MDDNYFYCSFSCSVQGPIGFFKQASQISYHIFLICFSIFILVSKSSPAGRGVVPTNVTNVANVAMYGRPTSHHSQLPQLLRRRKPCTPLTSQCVATFSVSLFNCVYYCFISCLHILLLIYMGQLLTLLSLLMNYH